MVSSGCAMEGGRSSGGAMADWRSLRSSRRLFFFAFLFFAFAFFAFAFFAFAFLFAFAFAFFIFA